MDPTVINAIIAGATAIVTLLANKLLAGWSEARRGKKDEAQRKALESDRLRSYARRLVEALHATRALALQRGITLGELPDFPERDEE